MLQTSESFDPVVSSLMENRPYIECWIEDLDQALNLLDLLKFHLANPDPEITGSHLLSLLRVSTQIMSSALDEYSCILNAAEKSTDRQRVRKEQIRKLNDDTLRALNQILRDTMSRKTYPHDTGDTPDDTNDTIDTTPVTPLTTPLTTHGHDTGEIVLFTPCSPYRSPLPFTLGSPPVHPLFTLPFTLCSPLPFTLGSPLPFTLSLNGNGKQQSVVCGCG